MSEPLLTHDGGVKAFEDAGGVVESSDDTIEFSWDEENVVTVDAPANLEGAFDTDQFYKIDGATIARPIKQAYAVGDSIEIYKKPAEELDSAAWSFDNAPFTIGHPDTGMVKDVDDIHGFWRNPRYDWDDHRLLEDLYVPVTDEDAIQWIEDNSDVSVGFYNRVHSDYDGNTGGLTDDDVDGFQVDMFGNHIAGVEHGRCPSEKGCGLDGDHSHGEVVQADGTPTHETMSDYDINPEVDDLDSITTDYTNSEGRYFAVSPDEGGGEPKFPINNCSDVDDAWHFAIRERGDISISFDTLKDRIKQKARDLDCEVPSESEESSDSQDCGCDPNEDDQDMGDTDNGDSTNDEFDIPDLSVDALAEKNEAVAELKEARDSIQSELDEMRSEVEEAFDSAENFSVELEEDECPCEAVDELVSDLDEKVDEVEDLREELSEYREDEIEERLDRLEELGADRDDWSETADEADDPLDALDEEIDRREEVLDATDEASVKDIDSTSDTDDETEGDDRGFGNRRTFGRGYGT